MHYYLKCSMSLEACVACGNWTLNVSFKFPNNDRYKSLSGYILESILVNFGDNDYNFLSLKKFFK